MRKQIKNDIDNLIALMDEAHKEIGVCEELSVECQNCAITIGTTLENDEEEDKKINCPCAGSYGHIVSELEQYCELMYQLHETFFDENTSQDVANTIINEIKTVFGDIKEMIDHIEVRKEVVFLPYNASMWDSLESVYLRYKAEPDYDAYVIPIPYYDKTPEGKFANMHYEGDRFPCDIPITDYNAYNLELRHPDIIYIHNPYDGTNYVTSVHPFFYSKNIKKFTDKLVYIPYFVLDEPRYPYEGGYENFVVVPAVIHADTVIVQSEMMRQVYINTMTKEVGENSRRIWERKILGLGSPKFDRVKRLRDNPVDMPEDWKQKIYKADGSKKKVILYNTSVVAMLKYRQSMIDKIHSVLVFFKSNTDNVVLLWRPHPLMKQTLASMRPELLDEYLDIVSRYQEADYGIYDTTSDIDRAIAIADAYYGDASSVVVLCQHAGIPVMIQNTDIL